MSRSWPWLSLGIMLVIGCSSTQPPPAPRELRAVWVATVANIDWPSKPGLTTEQQQQEAIEILDRCTELNINCVILQIRPAADALYASNLEPWSYFLTGEQGKAPDPYYDPLEFWISESHMRGMELHAWFNPYRVRPGSVQYTSSPDHVSRRNPRIVREFNGYQWLDPSEPEAQELTYRVFMDVAKRYDVDGLHIDDYFYPYPDYLKNAPFPDDEPWKRYQSSGGKLSRDDWRRENVNRLIKRVYTGLKREKPHVKFGISPFGIGHNRPKGVTGFDQYEKLYADAELWLREGWCDYYTPQIYWPIRSASQPFKPLLEFWVETNKKKRHIWPGLFTSKYEGDEIVSQVIVARETPGSSGAVHFSMKSIMRESAAKGDALKRDVYQTPALVPASPWLDRWAPGAPHVRIQRSSAPRAHWRPGWGEKPFLWAVWTKMGEEWKFNVYPADTRSMDLTGASEVCVSAVDRNGNESGRTRKRIK